MRVLYDHQIFSQQTHGGISRYHLELMKALAAEGTTRIIFPIVDAINIGLLCTRDIPVLSGARRAHRNELFSHLRRAIVRRLGRRATKLSLSRNDRLTIAELKGGRFDVFHPTYYGTYFLPYLDGRAKLVVTVHDMIQEIFPEYYSLGHSTKKAKRQLAERADAIITVSQTVKEHIVTILGVNPSKVHVVHHGVSLPVDLRSNEVIPELPDRYLLFVGGRAKYKNFYFFLTSIAALLLSENDMYLVCVGPKFSDAELRFLQECGIDDRVVRYDADDALLTLLYRGAKALVYPSLCEGFGIPIVEAFACGCPVLASDIPVFREVAGDAALYFNPKDAGSITESVRRLLADPDLISELRDRGLRMSARYSWSLTASRTLQVYNDIAE